MTLVMSHAIIRLQCTAPPAVDGPAPHAEEEVGTRASCRSEKKAAEYKGQALTGM
jgi:hypothetical protein